MSTIVFEGNTYTFGATVSANPGTGTTSYVFGGLSSGWTYGFIIWAFNGVGPSSIVGPTTRQTLAIAPLELRDDFGAVVWEYPPLPQSVLQYWTGSEVNLIGGSEQISPPYWSNPGLTRINAGITLPNGYNHGVIVILGDTQINTSISPILGLTYYFSWYEYRTYNTNQIGFLAYQGSNDISNIVGRQLLPQQGLTVGPIQGIPLGPTGGQTGWVRYAYEFVVQQNTSPIVLGWYTYGGGPGGTYYLGAPQLELAD